MDSGRARFFAVRVAAGAVSLTCALADYGEVMANHLAVPDSAQTEHLERRFQRPRLPKEAPPPVFPSPGKPLPPDAARKVRFVLSGVVITGVTAYRPEEIAPYYDAYQAREISLATVYEIAAAITEKYRTDGYMLSRAFVPAQKVRFGVVRIRVIEGYIDRVAVEGITGKRRQLIDTMARKIAGVRPASLDVVQRYVMLINDLPGITARASLQPSTGDSAAYVLSLAVEHRKLDAYADANNRGTELVGPHQFVAGVTLNSPLERHGATRLQFATTADVDELRYLSVTQEHPLGAEGTRVGVTGAGTWSRIDSSLPGEFVDSRTARFQLDIRHPVIRTRRHSFYGIGALSIYDSRATDAGQTSRDDRLRVARLGLTYHLRDDWDGQNWLTVAVSRGFDLWDASTAGSPNLSRADGHAVFTKANFSLTRLQGLGKSYSLLFSGQGQISVEPLLVAEEMTFGGARFGRAFDPAEISGEDGAALKLELRYTTKSDIQPIRRMQVYTYTDAGAIWDDDPNGGAPRRALLVASGIGVRLGFAQHGALYGEIAKPVLRDDAPGDDGVRFFFGLQARY